LSEPNGLVLELHANHLQVLHASLMAKFFNRLLGKAFVGAILFNHFE